MPIAQYQDENMKHKIHKILSVRNRSMSLPLFPFNWQLQT